SLDRLGQLFGRRPIRAQAEPRPPVFARGPEKASAHRAGESGALVLEASPDARALQAPAGIDIEKHGEIRAKAARREPVQALDLAPRQSPTGALVGEARGGETIAEHRSAVSKRRRDLPGDVFGPGGFVEKELRPRRHGILEDDVADRLREGRPAR